MPGRSVSKKTVIKKAVIPAGGFGTRMLPVSKAVPKEMLPLLDKPVMEYIVDEAIESGIEEILIILSRGKNAIPGYFDRDLWLQRHITDKLKEKKAVAGEKKLLELERKLNEIDIYYTRQKEPLGLGDAVMCARKFVGEEPFGVLLGDAVVNNGIDSQERRNKSAPCLKQLIDEYDDKAASIIGVREVPLEGISNYGLVKIDEAWPGRDNYVPVEKTCLRIESIIEKPSASEAPSNLGTMGRYVLEPEIFDCLEQQGPGVGGELQLTDAIDTLAGQKEVFAYIVEGKRYDTGDLMGYLEAMVELALEREDVGREFREYLFERE